jgi:hypothetical protein
MLCWVNYVIHYFVRFTSVSNFHYEMLVLSLDEPVLASPRLHVTWQYRCTVPENYK